jgi:hypothetical protein
MKQLLAAFAGTVRRFVRFPVVLSRTRYERILDRVIECRAIYDRHAGDDYHHGGAVANVPLADLAHICHVENELWADVQQRKATRKVTP